MLSSSHGSRGRHPTAGWFRAGRRPKLPHGPRQSAAALDGSTLIESIAAGCDAAGNVTLIGRRSAMRDLGFPVIADLIADCGPLGGLYTALNATDRRLESDGRLRHARAHRRFPGSDCSTPPKPSGADCLVPQTDSGAAIRCAPSTIAGCRRRESALRS